MQNHRKIFNSVMALVWCFFMANITPKEYRLIALMKAPNPEQLQIVIVIDRK